MRSTITPALLFATALTLPSLRALDAQTRTREPAEVRIERLPGGMSVFMGGSNRAVLGVTLAGDGKGSADGVRIEEVRADGPAAKAGLKVGDIITEVNGVSLRLSAADADDPELADVGQRRLQRTLAKARPGDDVDLRVQSGGSSRAVKVKTVSAADLDGSGERRVGQGGTWTGNARPALGLSVGASGSVRDTLGLFISSVVAKGPAELAGVVEGERIAAINGVDVRVPKEDVEDMRTAEARVNRFVREVQKGEAGATVTLRVYGGGRYREVSAKTIKSSELPTRGFSFDIGDGGSGTMRFMSPGSGTISVPGMLMPRTPMAPDGPGSPRIFLRERSGENPRIFEFDGGRGRIRLDGDELSIDREVVDRAMEGVRRGLQEMGRDLRIRVRDGVHEQTPGTPQPRVLPRRTLTVL